MIDAYLAILFIANAAQHVTKLLFNAQLQDNGIIYSMQIDFNNQVLKTI